MSEIKDIIYYNYNIEKNIIEKNNDTLNSSNALVISKLEEFKKHAENIKLFRFNPIYYDEINKKRKFFTNKTLYKYYKIYFNYEALRTPSDLYRFNLIDDKGIIKEEIFCATDKTNVLVDWHFLVNTVLTNFLTVEEGILYDSNNSNKYTKLRIITNFLERNLIIIMFAKVLASSFLIDY